MDGKSEPATIGTPAIVARGLTKRFGSTQAVDGLSFEVAPGRVTGFVGGGNSPVPLSADEVNQILYRQQSSAERPRPKMVFEKNDSVRIVDGPFANFSAIDAKKGTPPPPCSMQRSVKSVCGMPKRRSGLSLP